MSCSSAGRASWIWFCWGGGIFLTRFALLHLEEPLGFKGWGQKLPLKTNSCEFLRLSNCLFLRAEVKSVFLRIGGKKRWGLSVFPQQNASLKSEIKIFLTSDLRWNKNPGWQTEQLSSLKRRELDIKPEIHYFFCLAAHPQSGQCHDLKNGKNSNIPTLYDHWRKDT